MNNTYEFFIAGRTRNKENILKICDIFDEYNISYYCFLKNEKSFESFGNNNQIILYWCCQQVNPGILKQESHMD